MSATELAAARRALDETIGRIDSTVTTVEARVANLDALVADVSSAQKRLEEAQFNSRYQASFAEGDNERALREYTVGLDDEVRLNRGCYAQGSDGVVRLRGHTNAGGTQWRFGLLDDPDPKHEWQRELQVWATKRSIIRAHGVRETPFCDQMIDRIVSEAPEVVSRIFAKSATAGSEWIPQADMYAEVERALEYMPGITDLFPTRNMPPVHSYVLPYAEGELRPYKGRVPTTDDPGNYTLSSLATAQQTITPYKLVVASQAFTDALEDALLPVVDEIMMRAVRAIRLGRDDITINGDTAATHQDAIASWNTRGLWGASGLGTSDDHRTSAIGLRARAFDISNTTDQNATQTEAGFFTALSKLGAEYYSRAAFGGVKAIVSPEYWLVKMFQFSNMTTYDKAGPAATYLSGTLGGKTGPSPGSVGYLGGVEVCLSPFVTADQAATGLFTGSGALTGMLLVAPEDFELRVRKGARLDTVNDPRNDTTTWILKVREAFRTKAYDTVTTKKNVHYSFNLSSS